MRQQATDQLFAGGGEMGALLRTYDWSKTPFGPPEQWPQSLRSALSICLHSRFPMAIYWGPEGLLLYNDAWRPIVGDKHPWSVGRPAQEVWPEIWAEIGPEFAHVLATGEGIFHSDELLAMHRYGYTEECFFDYTFNPIQGESGRVEGILNVVSETTYRVLSDRRAQLLRELASKTARAKTLEEACALTTEILGSGRADVPLALLYGVNAEGVASLCPPAEAVAANQAPAQVSLNAGDAPGGWPIAAVTQSAQPQTLEDLPDRFGDLPGSPWPEPPQQAMVLPVVVPGQAQAAAVLVAVASPRRRLDDNYRDFFKQIAAQLALSIANARAYEEERRRAEQLAEIDRAKTVFFSNVSHEFRTPLALMLGPVEDALQHTQDPDQRDRLAMVQRNALRLQKLVNTLLDFSRLEAGRIEAVYEPTDLSRLTTDLAGVFRAAIEQAGLRLGVDCPPLPEPVYVDREMWEKIVLNLLSNAFKFTFEGAIEVALRPTTEQNQVRLEVSDTGIGIPAQELPHIFERFHRVPGARGRTHEGSGIGLSLVQELVTLHGGHMEVTSAVGQGTRFAVTLPLGLAHLPGDRIGTPRTQASTAIGPTPYLEEAITWLPAPNPPAPAPTALALPRLLLADDNGDMLDYVSRLLGPQYQVETVRHGQAALAAIRRQPPDLVLSDVMMPELDGFELLRQLRADPQTQELPIILLSARAGEAARLEGLAAGADDYLTKPFSARELLARVEATLKLAQMRQEAKAVLQRSEERYRTLFEAMEEGFGICEMLFDASGAPIDYRFLEINPAFEILSGIPQMAGKTAKELVPDLEDIWVETYSRMLATGEPCRFEHASVPLGRWFSVSAFALKDPQNRRFAILFTDITDRRRAERERERFLAVGSDLQVISGSDGYFKWVSPTLERLLGWTPEEMTARPWVEFIHPDDLDRTLKQDANLFRVSQDLLSFENRYRHKDGSYRWFLWNAQPYPTEQLIYAAAIDITDLKRTESNLRESETRFRQMTDAAPMMVWLAEPDQRCIYFNQSWLAFTGRTLEQETGLGWTEGIHPDDAEFCLGIYTHAFNARTPFQMEYRLRHASGEYRWVFDVGEPRFSSDGSFLGYIGSCFDIHNRKQAEETLRQRETELRLVTNAVPALIAFVDAEQRYRFNNQGYENWFGQSAAEIYGKPLWEVMGQEAYERVRPYVEQVLAGQQVTFERSVEFQNGRIRYLTATYVPRFSDQGRVEGFVALITDLSDRKQAEIALSQSEERYRYLVESIPQLVWTANPEGMIVDTNQRWLSFTGLSLEQVQAEGWQTVVYPEDVPTLAQNWAIAQQQGTNYQAEGRMRRADGVYRWHLHQAVPMKDPEGRVLKWFGTATDIEDQKQLEQQRSQLLRQERAARAAAEAASRTKDEFLAVVSHELRSPLNPILGWATLLQTGTLSDAKTRQALAVIERNARLQTELIDDLLDVSRMLRGKLEINATAVNLAATIRAAVETVRLAAEAKSIALDVHLDNSSGLVSGDSTRLQQVVWNLLSNAVKFTPTGGQVTVGLARADDNQAVITVSDTGKGIAQDFLPLMFDYFRQADSATTRQFGGLGLGLAIVRHLVELHGGTICADSPGEGQGATFTVTLPTLARQPDADPGPGPPECGLNLSGTRLLVVDDEADTRNFIVFLLEQAGATVVSAASADAALAALKQSPPQVLISDVGMPEVDGYMLMRQIRALPPDQGGQVPAIALTAYARETDQEQALTAGFQRHIPKPVQPAALVQALVELLQAGHPV
ncbi:PAS domain S-box protein [Leptolyngbya sp. KIOST-1]|uniref:PAS domain S-box protein n=1 Tax=Leptolyngbya sp. KIOST-1 TaxID=1229172 RepID=UPI00056CC211|nr:PAS domain S-box protein [Leptolyngbya sp. KIOST-1]